MEKKSKENKIKGLDVLRLNNVINVGNKILKILLRTGMFLFFRVQS